MISKLRKLKSRLTDIYIIRSASLFKQERSFFFRIFRREYQRYKKWIEPAVKQSKLPIDVIVPVIKKDLHALPLVIAGIRQHIKHPITNIYIVAPLSNEIQKVVENNNCVFVSELQICNTTKQQIGFFINGNDRSGWIYQQLLKLNFDKVGTCDNYLVVDADTVFIQDTIFETRGKTYFDFSDEYHTPYFKTFEVITKLKHQLPVSFITHYMLFNKTMLQKLVKHIEQVNNSNVEKAIIAMKDVTKDEQSYFSEYETYANFCIQTNPNSYLLRYWFNKSCKQNETENFGVLKRENALLFKTLSFHSHFK